MYPKKRNNANLYVAYRPENEVNILPGYKKYVHYDLELEECILGAILCEKDAFSLVRPLLHPDTFYHDFHQAVFQCFAEMFEKSIPIDIKTAFHYVRKTVEEKHPMWAIIPDLETLDYRLGTLTHKVAQSIHIEAHALILNQLHAERILYELGQMFQHDMGQTETFQKVQDLNDRLLEIRGLGQEEDWLELSTILMRTWQHIQRMEGRELPGVPSGFKRFDAITGGFAPKGVHYLAGRPASGKTALALKTILNQIHKDIPVAIISLETPDIQLATRLLAMVSSFDFQQIWRGRLSEEAKKTLYSYTQSMADLPLFVGDKPAVNMGDIRAKYMKLRRRYHAQMAKKYGADWKSKVPEEQHSPVLWIDYLQLITTEEAKNKTREQEIAKISRGLKLLAMEENIPVIALAQLNRESEKRTDKRPRLSDLRESGSLEQDADGIMLIYRPWTSGIKTDENGRSTERYAELIVAKWRNGMTFSNDMEFRGAQMDFSEMADDDEGYNFGDGGDSPF